LERNLQVEMKRWFWLIFLAPFLVYIPNLEKFAFITLSEYSDLLISHWPNAYFIHNAIFQMREFPLWTDAILGGYPLIANPLAGFWYPPNWLTFLFPYPITYNLLFFAHVFIGALAVYYILRDEEFSMEIAILGGVIFELMPKIWAHYAAGHISLVFSVCLTPLLLLVSRRALASEMKGKYLHLPGLVIAGIILADARWLVYALIVESFFLLYFLDMHSTSIHSSKKKISLYFFGEFLIGLLLSSILLIPLAEYISLSTRSSMTLRDNLIYSLPFEKTIYFIFPQIGGIAEWVIYLGGFGAIVLVLSLVNKQIRRKSIHWLILFLIAWLISISGSIPILSRLWELPGMSLIRVPSRVIFVCGISLCFLAAICLNELYNSRFNKRVTNLSLVGILAFSSLSLILSIFLTNGTKIGIQWGSLSLFVFSTILFIALNRSRLTKAWIYVMTGFVILDLAGVTFQSIRFLEFTKAVSTGESLLQSITQDPSSDFRIFTPSDSIPQQTAAFHQLEMANGIDPLQLKSYVKYFNFKEKDGTILEGYSVTLPPFITGHPRIDNIDLQGQIVATAKDNLWV